MRIRTVVLAMVLALVAASCDRSAGEPSTAVGDDAITVGSFDFPESEVIAEIYAGALEAEGFRVVREPAIGTREVVLPALQLGLIEVVPEYAGSALTFLGGTASADPAVTNALLASIVADRGLTALEPAAAENRNGMVVTAETAADLDLRTVSDLAPSADSMVFGGPPECPERDFCLPGLETIYGLHFESFLPLDTGGPLSADAIQRGTVDVGMLFTTDGTLAGDDLVLLRDDRHLQPAESVTPIVRADTLERFGDRARSALDAVSEQLTTEDLREMNASMSAGATPKDVAATWLEDHGLGAAG
ncbi:MAG TPA: ABC transporter substrate-binding protein [Actinomycetota bacterium]